jgi:hypothetical protein
MVMPTSGLKRMLQMIQCVLSCFVALPRLRDGLQIIPARFCSYLFIEGRVLSSDLRTSDTSVYTYCTALMPSYVITVMASLHVQFRNRN